MIDLTRIHELRAEIGRDDLAAIVAVYREEAEATLARITPRLPRQDYARALHFLRSGALNIGLSGISDLAATLETDLAGEAVDQDGGRRRLAEALDRTMAELDEALG